MISYILVHNQNRILCPKIHSFGPRVFLPPWDGSCPGGKNTSHDGLVNSNSINLSIEGFGYGTIPEGTFRKSVLWVGAWPWAIMLALLLSIIALLDHELC